MKGFVIPLVLALFVAGCGGNDEGNRDAAGTGTQPGVGEEGTTATEPVVEGLRVTDLAGVPLNRGNTWKAQVTVTVADMNDDPIPGAEVFASWTEGDRESVRCITNVAGRCPLTSGDIRKNVTYATLVIGDIVHEELPWVFLADYDPDELTTGTSIEIRKP